MGRMSRVKCRGPDLRHEEKGYQNGGKKQWEISGNFEDEKRLGKPFTEADSRTVAAKPQRVRGSPVFCGERRGGQGGAGEGGVRGGKRGDERSRARARSSSVTPGFPPSYGVCPCFARHPCPEKQTRE